jgi:hypothetical protein
MLWLVLFVFIVLQLFNLPSPFILIETKGMLFEEIMLVVCDAAKRDRKKMLGDKRGSPLFSGREVNLTYLNLNRVHVMTHEIKSYLIG